MISRQSVRENGQEMLRLIFLGSCESAQRSAKDAFRGLAPRLMVDAETPAVLAMQETVGMEMTRAFTSVFYRQLLTHGRLDLACNEARSAILTWEHYGAYIPILFSRLEKNQLLEPTLLQPPTPRLPFEPEVIFIRSGKFFMGGSPTDPDQEVGELPAGWLDLPAYCIGKYPVTNLEYYEFVKDAGIKAPQKNWEGYKVAKGKEQYPVAGVSWQDAQRYCRWLSEKTGRNYRLPSEAEWEKAARGMESMRIFPWGDEWQPKRCNADKTQITAKAEFEPQTPFGCCDMVGNLREWTSTQWGSQANQSDYPYPWQTDGRDTVAEDLDTESAYRICRGGTYLSDRRMLRCSAREWVAPDIRLPSNGFRVVMAIA